MMRGKVNGIDIHGNPENTTDISDLVYNRKSVMLINNSLIEMMAAKNETVLKSFKEFVLSKTDICSFSEGTTYTCISGVPLVACRFDVSDRDFRTFTSIISTFNRKNKPIKDNKQYMEITHENRIIAGKIPTTKIGKTKDLKYCFFMIALTSEELINFTINMKSLGYAVERTLKDKDDRFKDEYKRRYIRTATKRFNDKIAFQFTFSVIEKRTPVHVMAENDTYIVYVGIDKLEQIDRNQKELLSIVEHYNKMQSKRPFCIDVLEEVKRWFYVK